MDSSFLGHYIIQTYLVVSTYLVVTIFIRLLIAILILSTLYLLIVYLIDRLFRQNYSDTYPLKDGKEEDIEDLEEIVPLNTEEVEDISFSFVPSSPNLSDTPVSADESHNTSIDFDISYLDHRTFYKNLNNSSQYLRRDSFSYT